MKQVKFPMTLALVLASILFLALMLARIVPTATAAPPAPQAPNMRSTNYTMDWSAVGEISGGSSSSTNYKLNATIGQMAANTSSTSTNYGLCTGFECVANILRLYLPLIMR